MAQKNVERLYSLVAAMKDKLSKSVYGISLSDAHLAKICINCREPAWKNIRSDEEHDEYKITGLCGVCWDKIFPKD